MADVSNNWQSEELDDALHSKTMILNMGPAHPATHGTARLIVELDGEIIQRCDVDVGYLHRGFEKQCETVDYNQVVPYTDRLNYVSPIINNVGYCIAIEKLFGVEATERCQYIRVIVSELSRMCDHLTCVGAASMELGAFTVMLYLMQARELLYELIEMVTGARLTISYVRVGGLRDDLPEGFREEVLSRFEKIKKHLADADGLISKNRIFADRMCDVGIISPEEAVAYSLTGPLLRASGVNYDVRKAFPYSGYEKFEFDVPLGKKGDNFDRFHVRYLEIFQSIRIVEQALKNIPDGPINIDDPRIIMPPKDEVYNSIEGMISQFEVVFKGVQPPAGDVYFACEGGNGELGFYVISDGSGKPYKVRVRPPSFIAMGIMGPLVEGHSIADIVPIFGMINMIGGECDR
ncbi:MAG: NADH-quinone oxidoreductase subunit D [Proteobacteria bacterium]|nr:NADH-quinone oxidoreductase subunit D [Pseudomonadota bacterium]